MADCPNCGRHTLRTKDWVCQWCGYPLISKAFKVIDKTYKELEEERKNALKPTDSEDEPETVTEYKPEPPPKAKPQVKPVAKSRPAPVPPPQSQPDVTPSPVHEPPPQPQASESAPPAPEVIQESAPIELPPPAPEPPAETQPVAMEPPAPEPVAELKPSEEPPPEPVAESKPSEEPPPAPEPVAEQVQPEAPPPPPPVESEPPPEPEPPPMPPPAKKPELVVPEPPPEPTIKLEDIQDGMEIAAEQIDALFRVSKEKASNAFADKTMVIKGIVEKVFIKDQLDIRYIMVASAKEEMSWGLRCTFNKEETAKISRLQEKQEIAVQGKYEGYSKNIIFKDCVLV